MSEAPKPPSAAVSAPSPAPPPKAIENPLTSWVRGGTLTAPYERQLQAQRLDADERRRVQDQKYQIARQNPNEARLGSMALGGSRSHLSIVLGIKHPKDTTILDWMVCELIQNGSDEEFVKGEADLILCMVCPLCVKKDPQNAQIMLRQSNRRFEFTPSSSREIWVNPENPNEVVTVAGKINLTEWAQCGGLGCSYKFKIENNILRSD